MNELKVKQTLERLVSFRLALECRDFIGLCDDLVVLHFLFKLSIGRHWGPLERNEPTITIRTRQTTEGWARERREVVVLSRARW